jgi:hypothetical protein
MVAEKWLQAFIDVIREKRCVTRRYLVDYIVTKHEIPVERALDIVDDTLAALVKRGVITRKGRGVYCWAGPP